MARQDPRPHSLGVDPFDDESFIGWMFRSARHQRLATGGNVAYRCGMAVLTRNPSEGQLACLAAYSRMPVERLRLISRGDPGGTPTRYRHVIIPRQSYIRHAGTHRSVCPACLAEAPYHRGFWDMVYISACPVHLATLVDTCPQCGQALAWRGRDLLKCGCAGGRSLAEAPSLRLPREQAYGTAVVQGLLGDTRFAAEAARTFELEPFRDLQAGLVIDFIFRVGLMSLDLKLKKFAIDHARHLFPRSHVALNLGLDVAHHWPQAFLTFASGRNEARGFAGDPRLGGFSRALEEWVNTLPKGQGAPIRDAVVECRRLASARFRSRRQKSAEAAV